MKHRWFPIKYHPDAGTVLTRIRDRGKETIFETTRGFRYRRIADKGKVSWFSIPKERPLEGDQRTRRDPSPNADPPTESKLELVCIEGECYLFRNQHGDLYKSEQRNGALLWTSNARRARRKNRVTGD
jgi:hypothetical protein